MTEQVWKVVIEGEYPRLEPGLEINPRTQRPYTLQKTTHISAVGHITGELIELITPAPPGSPDGKFLRKTHVFKTGGVNLPVTIDEIRWRDHDKPF